MQPDETKDLHPRRENGNNDCVAHTAKHGNRYRYEEMVDVARHRIGRRKYPGGGVPPACNRVWRSTALRGYVSTKDTKEVCGGFTEHLPLKNSLSLCDCVR